MYGIQVRNYLPLATNYTYTLSFHRIVINWRYSSETDNTEYEGFDLTMITATEQPVVVAKADTLMTEVQKEMMREADAWIEQKKMNA